MKKQHPNMALAFAIYGVASAPPVLADVMEFYPDGRIYNTTLEFVIEGNERRPFLSGVVDATSLATELVTDSKPKLNQEQVRERDLEVASAPMSEEAVQLLAMQDTSNFTKSDFRIVARAIAAEHLVPSDLFETLVQRESAYNPKAVSHAGALGLAQLMPGTAEYLGVNPNDPIENLTGGARYLAEQFKTFGDWKLALAAYNAGPGAVRKYDGIPPYKETQEYVRWITTKLGNAFPTDDESPASKPARAIKLTQNVMEF